jgi:uncharacterized metal-binding protein YceD (DUF177 family)
LASAFLEKISTNKSASDITGRYHFQRSLSKHGKRKSFVRVDFFESGDIFCALMKVYVLQIPDEGKHFEGEEPSDVLELNDDRMRAVGSITYSLDVGVSEDGVWARGEVVAEVECECVRCLEKFRRELRVPDFACQVELQGRDMVDLTEPIREDILLVLPAHPLCDWDGKKTCKVRFSTEQNTVEPLGEKADIWKALDNIKI